MERRSLTLLFLVGRCYYFESLIESLRLEVCEASSEIEKRSLSMLKNQALQTLFLFLKDSLV